MNNEILPDVRTSIEGKEWNEYQVYWQQESLL